MQYQVNMIMHDNKFIQGNFFIAGKVSQTAYNYFFVFVRL